jgi:hypothetical protein
MRDAHRLPMSRHIAVWTLVASLGFAAGCGGDEAPASKETATAAEVAETKPGADGAEKAGAEKDKDDRPSKSRATKDRPSKASTAGDGAKPAATGDKIGIAACDDYLKTVHECGNKSQIDVVEKSLAAKWREALADGKPESEVQPLCEKAASLFKCRK